MAPQVRSHRSDTGGAGAHFAEAHFCKLRKDSPHAILKGIPQWIFDPTICAVMQIEEGPHVDCKALRLLRSTIADQRTAIEAAVLTASLGFANHAVGAGLVVTAQDKPRYGYRRLQVLVQREGQGVNGVFSALRLQRSSDRRAILATVDCEIIISSLRLPWQEPQPKRLSGCSQRRSAQRK